MSNLKHFIDKVEGFYTLSSGDQIKYFAYYILHELNQEFINASTIRTCYDDLLLNPYSNIPKYLKQKSAKGNSQLFIKKNNGYTLHALASEKIAKEIGIPKKLTPDDSLFPLSIFDHTRKYLIRHAQEASICYRMGLYDPCLFLLRKIMEILIVELYESKYYEAEIKDHDGNYFQLSRLTSKLISDTRFKLSKLPKEQIPKVKDFADSSVHSRRFNAKKSDIDSIQADVRIIFEELVVLTDYPNWK
jgi:hypothetical protein